MIKILFDFCYPIANCCTFFKHKDNFANINNERYVLMERVTHRMNFVTLAEMTSSAVVEWSSFTLLEQIDILTMTDIRQFELKRHKIVFSRQKKMERK